MKETTSRKKDDMESLKSEFRWQIGLCFFFTVFVFGTALLSIALGLETRGAHPAAITAYVAIAALIGIVGIVGMVWVAFQVARSYKDSQTKKG